MSLSLRKGESVGQIFFGQLSINSFLGAIPSHTPARLVSKDGGRIHPVSTGVLVKIVTWAGAEIDSFGYRAGQISNP